MQAGAIHWQLHMQAVTRRLRLSMESEEGHYAALADYSFVRRGSAAQPPEVDRVVNVGIAAVCRSLQAAPHTHNGTPACLGLELHSHGCSWWLSYLLAS